MVRRLLNRAVPVAAGALLLIAPGALAHGDEHPEGALSPARAGSAEAAMRAFETENLGADHARAHALQRQTANANAIKAARSGDDVRERKAATRAGPLPEVVSRKAGGTWSGTTELPVVAINAVLLHTGKILYYAYPRRPLSDPDPNYLDYARAYLYDPATGSSKEVDPPIDTTKNPDSPTNIFCSGASMLPDGRVLVAGGNLGNPFIKNLGLRTVFTFDPATETWQRHADMRQGRWYPTQTLTPSGDTLIAGGLTETVEPGYQTGTVNLDLEIYTADGQLKNQEDFFSHDGTPGKPELSGLYPRVMWMPSGRAFSAGPYASDTWFLNPPATPNGNWTSTGAPDMSRDREFGSAVLLQGGRVMTFGGSGTVDTVPDVMGQPQTLGKQRPATATTESFDEDQPGWVAGKNMSVARSHANAVLTPDGKVALIGGGLGEDGSRQFYRWLLASENDRRPEIYDPATDTFSGLGNPQLERRTYHSTALLLPDGRIWSAGDDINGTPIDEVDQNPDSDIDTATGAGLGTEVDTAEIWSPPYLFDNDGSPAPRPVIDAAPTAMPNGADFEIQASGAKATKAVLVAPGAPTHAFDMSQRYVELAAPVETPGGRLKLHVPENTNVAIPAYYMLFLLSADGTPSVAKFIRVGAPAAGELPPYQPPPPPPEQPPPPPPPPPSCPTKATAKISLARASTSGGRLDVLAPITKLASGTVKVSYQAAGKTTKFTTKVDAKKGRIAFDRKLSAAQAKAGTGILTLEYPGDDDTRAQTVRLRAAAGKSNLVAPRPKISKGGRLTASGTVSTKAKGVVRVELEYQSGCDVRVVRTNAKIDKGKWRVSRVLDQKTRDEIDGRSGTVHSYTLFTGYKPAKLRGEMRAYEVVGNR